MATNSERETVIRWGPSDPGVAAVWTNEPAVWRRLEKAGYAPERVTKALGGHITGKFFTVSKKLITIRRKLASRPAHRPRGRQFAKKTRETPAGRSTV